MLSGRIILLYLYYIGSIPYSPFTSWVLQFNAIKIFSGIKVPIKIMEEDHAFLFW